ncbi:MAG: hypothetical protein KatS3mg101_0850 [Patescibacteria group bacterium]|nr:MAG: hypothetical protein KatS3mg101_0850 [Patescibacteria group bacterium]
MGTFEKTVDKVLSSLSLDKDKLNTTKIKAIMIVYEDEHFKDIISFIEKNDITDEFVEIAFLAKRVNALKILKEKINTINSNPKFYLKYFLFASIVPDVLKATSINNEDDLHKFMKNSIFGDEALISPPLKVEILDYKKETNIRSTLEAIESESPKRKVDPDRLYKMMKETIMLDDDFEKESHNIYALIYKAVKILSDKGGSVRFGFSFLDTKRLVRITII